jgi:AbrB family looped-hinge helix DNA binding protein
MEIIVRKKGQITIPAQLRKKYKITAGTSLQVREVSGGIVLKPLSIWDMIGSGSSKANVTEMKRLLDKLRQEDT